MIIPKPLQLIMLLLSLPILTELPTEEKRSLGGVSAEFVLDWAADIFAPVTVGGTVLPSPEYLADDLQYFPPDQFDSSGPEPGDQGTDAIHSALEQYKRQR